MSLSQVYRRSAAEFIGVVGGLSSAQLEAGVPACPAWTVHDLLAHQAGSSSDFADGRLDGVTTASWSARQVEDRRARSVDELVKEWESHVDAVATQCDAIPGPNPAWDVAVHLADLCEAVGLPPKPAHGGWGEVLPAAVGLLGQCGSTVSIGQYEPDPGDTTWHVATAYGLWRGMFSRLDPATLESEVIRGDVHAFAQAAFFAG